MGDEQQEQKFNFFNLETSSTEEDEETEMIERKLTKEDEEKIKKWDWDKEENYDLYYGKEAVEKSMKRSKDAKEIKRKMLKIDDQIEPVIENDLTCKFKLVGHKSSVNRIHWSRTNDNLILSSSMDSNIIIWNLNNQSKHALNKPIKMFIDIHSKAIRDAIWSNSEAEIVSVSYDESCALTDIETGKEKARLRHNQLLTTICNNLTDENIKLIGSKNEILSWDTRTPNPCKIYKTQMGQLQDLVFLNENEFVSCGDRVSKDSAEYSIIVWDLKTTAILSNQIFHEKFICTCLKKHPTNELFFAQTHGNYIAEFSSRTPFKMNKYKRYENHATQGYSIGFDINQSGSLISTGSADGCVYIYNCQTSKLIKKLDAFNKELVKQPCTDAKFQPFRKKYLAASSWSGSIKVFEFDN